MKLSPAELSVICAAAVPLLYVLLMALGRTLKRRAGVQLNTSYRLFCVVLAFYIPVSILHLQVPDPGFDLGLALMAMTMLLGAFVVMALLRRYLWEMYFEQRRQMPIPKLLRQLVSLFVFAFACVLVLLMYNQGEVARSFVTGSSVIAVILGFAMQNLLGNIIAGITLEIGKPFKPGDWLQVDGQVAEVIEVNWRSTRLRTNDDICLDIPNNQIVSHTIVNVSHPTKRHAHHITVGIDYSASPNFVKEILVKAAAAGVGVLDLPHPKAYLKDYADSAVLYDVKFWIEDEQLRNDIMDSVRTNIWYALRRHGVQIPYPIRTLQLERQSKQAKPAVAPNSVAHGALRVQPFFQCLGEGEMQALLCGAKMLRFGRGERIIVQGDEGYSMFVMVNGVAGVLVAQNGGPAHEVAKLHSGDYFGEMSLLTGDPRSATIVAESDCEVLEIDKAIFGEIVASNPELLRKLSEVLSTRRLEMEGVLASKREPTQLATLQQEYSANLLKRISAFFEL